MVNNFQRKRRRQEGNFTALVPIKVEFKTRDTSALDIKLTEEINKKVTFSEAQFPKGTN